MQEIGSYEAKTHLPSLLNRVAKGERIVITKHGSPVAMLVPFTAPASLETKVIIDQIREFRKNLKLDGLSLKAMIKEGRRR
jgi:prevent-host-death family protein